MAKLRVHNFAMSLDGFAAGPDQDLENPMGVGGMALHQWALATKFFGEMMGTGGGGTGIDNDFAEAGVADIGATIMGRNMFGPVRGPWPDVPAEDQWNGWWGPNPPFHHPVFVLTHHARSPLAMEGGTTFYFTDDPIESVLERAYEAADGKDVRLGGGTSTVRQYMRAGLADEVHIALVPVLLGHGEQLLADPSDYEGYQCTRYTPSPAAAHMILTRG